MQLGMSVKSYLKYIDAHDFLPDSKVIRVMLAIKHVLIRISKCVVHKLYFVFSTIVSNIALFWLPDQNRPDKHELNNANYFSKRRTYSGTES